MKCTKKGKVDKEVHPSHIQSALTLGKNAI